MRLSYVRCSVALAVAVSATAVSPAGAHTPVDDPKQFGEWIADVERPAEQYRGRYQLRLGEARSLLPRSAG
jgi:hypothetical protein